MSGKLSIGRFAQITRLTPRALRLYDELGLLSPAYTDPHTGYRYYRIQQIELAERIRELRELEVPLEDIRQGLQNTNPWSALLLEHRQRLAHRQMEISALLERLDRLLKEPPVEYTVEIKQLAAQPIVFERLWVVLPETQGLIGQAFQKLYSQIHKAGLELVGPRYCAYPIPQEGERVPVDVVVPIHPKPNQGPLQIGEQPAGWVASTLHRGPYHDLPKAFRAVHAWIETNDYQVIGPPREIYLEHGPVPLTEVAFPVSKAP